VLDAEFSERFPNYISQLPVDWDMVLFGGIHGLPIERVTDNVMRITNSLSTYAYAMKHTIYDGFIELNRLALTVLDENTRELQKRFNCYCFMPHLAWVEEDYSDVREERNNLWWLKESLVLWGAEMDDILRSTVVIISHRSRGPNAVRNLKFIASYYDQQLPGVTLLIVEQGDEPIVQSGDLPPRCGYLFLKDSGGNSRAFNLGFEMFESVKEFFIFTVSDILITREDIKANLLKCRDYDFATSFLKIYDLDEDDTRRILNNDLRWDYNGNYQPLEKAAVCSSSCIITKSGMLLIGGCDETEGPEASRTSQKVRRELRIYQSPNLARHLYQG
jgi:hypothetical protein